jgi:hypothetical protein
MDKPDIGWRRYEEQRIGRWWDTCNAAVSGIAGLFMENGWKEDMEPAEVLDSLHNAAFAGALILFAVGIVNGHACARPAAHRRHTDRGRGRVSVSQFDSTDARRAIELIEARVLVQTLALRNVLDDAKTNTIVPISVEVAVQDALDACEDYRHTLQVVLDLLDGPGSARARPGPLARR